MSLRHTALVAAVGLLAFTSRASAQATGGPDWNAWPWMSAQVPAQIELSAKAVATDSAPGFHAILILRNAGSDSVRIRFGSCSFGLRLYRDNAFRAPPLWDNRPGPNVACTLEGHELRLGPNEQRAQVVSMGYGLLKQPPGPGRYFASITWRPSGETPVRDVAAGGVVIR